jgi:multiple sugar transport system substrate-binding protein
MRRNPLRLGGLAAVAAVVTLAGCGMGGASKGDAQKTVDTSAAIKGSITFQTWSLKGDKFTPYFTALIAAYQAKHPGATVNWVDQPGDGYPDKVTSQVTAGSLPDVINLPPDIAHSVAEAGDLLDLSTNDKTLTANYVKSGLGAYTYPGLTGTFAYPWYLGTDVNYWNTQMFAKDGLDPKQPPTTLDELLADARTMHDKSGGKDFLLSRKPGLADFVNAGVPLMSSDAKKFTFNTPAAEALIDKYAAAYKAGLMPSNVLSSDYEGNSALFSKAEVAWTTGTGYFIQGVATSSPSLAKQILPSAAIGTPPLYVQGIAISSKSKNLPMALSFAQFVTDNANQIAFVKLAQGYLPGTTAAAADPSFSKSDGTPQGNAAVLAYQGMQKAVNFTPAAWTDAMGTYLDQQVALAISGKESAKTALDSAVNKANQLLAD